MRKFVCSCNTTLKINFAQSHCVKDIADYFRNPEIIYIIHNHCHNKTSNTLIKYLNKIKIALGLVVSGALSFSTGSFYTLKTLELFSLGIILIYLL